MKTIKFIAIAFFLVLFMSANAQSFTVESPVDTSRQEVKTLPNITVLSLDGKEVLFTTACGMKHVVLCNIGAPNVGNWMNKFKEAGVPSVSLISWAPMLTKGMTKYMLAFYKKTFYRWEKKYGVTYNIDCQQNMVNVWGLPKDDKCMYVFVLGEEGEILYSAASTNADSFDKAIIEAAKYMK
ncbi:MAG: hypothetical protein IKL20_02880 [Alistipes sp.]|nr:hypothetical protein [Alistipes sp.]